MTRGVAIKTADYTDMFESSRTSAMCHIPERSRIEQFGHNPHFILKSYSMRIIFEIQIDVYSSGTKPIVQLRCITWHICIWAL